MSGSPDYTTDVSITGYTIESLPIDISAQTISTIAINIRTTEIMNPTDLQGSTIMVPIDIQGQYITLDIDIVAQTVGNIDIDIAAQSMGNLSVDLAAQSVGNVSVDLAAQTVGNLAVDITAQSLGTVGIQINTEQSVSLWIGGEWGSKTSNDVDAWAAEETSSGALTTILQYTVPAGKTLLIYDVGAGNEGGDEGIIMEVYNNTTSARYAESGGLRGCAIAFFKPKRATTGQVVQIRCLQNSGSTRTICAYLGGVLI